MDFGFDPTTLALMSQLTDFMATHVYPAEPVFAEQARHTTDQWDTPAIIDDLKAEARQRGLWNLFLPHSEYGAGLTNLQYAPLAEISGRSPLLAPEAMNCSPPDTGNMELLAQFGTIEQKERWLDPLLAGAIRSSFAMTEPDVASSDASNIATDIRREGDEYVINGGKVWITGALSPRCQLLIVLGRSNPDADRHHRHSIVLIPKDTPGVEIRRGMTVYGYDDAAHGGHGDIRFADVRIPVSFRLGAEGEGFAMAQARLGPGRIHHCMRLIGMAERAMDLLRQRTADRVAFGQPLAANAVIQEWAADARVRIEQARLLVLKTAWLMDTVGNRAAHTEIQAIKIAVPSMATWILDKVVQSHGAQGLSQDTPLAQLWATARTLRLADGPDEVHRRSLGRRELRGQTVASAL